MPCRCLNCILPPHILEKLCESSQAKVRDAAMRTLLATTRLRGERAVRATLFGLGAPTEGRRSIFDCRRRPDTRTAVLVRTEQGPASADGSVNAAFEGLGVTRDFYREVLGRNSLDDLGMRLDGYVHYDEAFNNAFWDGQQMVFGDGDRILFTDFTGSLDVIAHELTHGVIEHAAGLIYANQSGALNESLADVFGSLVKQWSLKQDAAEADWLIGADIFTPDIEADALRSMKDPGSAFDNPTLGKDPQPGHMDQFRRMPEWDDNGGVHVNSGIPNRAFYLAATNIGGKAWEAPGHIWYEALKASSPDTDFQAFAETTTLKAGQIYGPAEQKAVRAAWAEVGIDVAGVAMPEGFVARSARPGSEAETLAEMQRQLAELTRMVAALTKPPARRKEKA